MFNILQLKDENHRHHPSLLMLSSQQPSIEGDCDMIPPSSSSSSPRLLVDSAMEIKDAKNYVCPNITQSFRVGSRVISLQLSASDPLSGEQFDFENVVETPEFGNWIRKLVMELNRRFPNDPISPEPIMLRVSKPPPRGNDNDNACIAEVTLYGGEGWNANTNARIFNDPRTDICLLRLQGSPEFGNDKLFALLTALYDDDTKEVQWDASQPNIAIQPGRDTLLRNFSKIGLPAPLQLKDDADCNNIVTTRLPIKLSSLCPTRSGTWRHPSKLYVHSPTQVVIHELMVTDEELEPIPACEFGLALGGLLSVGRIGIIPFTLDQVCLTGNAVLIAAFVMYTVGTADWPNDEETNSTGSHHNGDADDGGNIIEGVATSDKIKQD